MEALSALLGARLRGGEEGTDELETAAALEGKTFVGLYFASQATEEFTVLLVKAYEEVLGAKGLEVVFVTCDQSEEDSEASFAEMPWLALPFDCQAEQQELLSRFAVKPEEVPKLVILDVEGAVCTIDGVQEVSSDPTGENFPWRDPVLTETDILERLGAVPPEGNESGIKGIFINSKNYLSMGWVDAVEEDDSVPFSGMKLKPYVFVAKQKVTEELKRMGFASDFHPHQKEIEKFTGIDLLLFFDPEKSFGEKIVWCTNQAAVDREWARVQRLQSEVLAEHEQSLQKRRGGGEGADGEKYEPEENIVMRDEPKECRPWSSPTMEATHLDVANFTVHNTRPPIQVMIMRPRSLFGKPFKFSDSAENMHNCRPQKDPNFALQRKELEIGIQAVKETRSLGCQTLWYRPVNKSTQYSPNDFLPRDASVGYNKLEELTEFLKTVSVSVEEALQTNETVDIFQEEFEHLGEEEAGGGAASDTHSSIKDLRTFHDVTYTKGKRIEWVEWIPGSTDMLACSCCENMCFTDRLDNAGKATISTILVWSFQDSLSPHAIMVAPWEVPVFKFYPSDEKYVVGGLSSGQLAVWKLTDADLGYALREKQKGSSAGGEEEKSTSIPTVPHKQISIIDESHKKPVLGIEWLPATLEIERRNRISEKNPKDGPVKYFLSIAGDGQVMIWDFQALLEALNDSDFIFRPLHKIQLQRQDSGTEMGCTHILYCHNRHDDKGTKMLTNFYACTEEGELIFGDWGARMEEDRKPEYCKRIFAVSKTFRPMLSLERSPFFPDILLGVTDWAFYIWKDGLKEHLFQSSYNSTYFTRGVWSPSRPSVIFLGLNSGGIDIWDFSDQSHKASLSAPPVPGAISSMVFRRGEVNGDQLLAVGDAHGQLHVLMIPKNLVRQAGKELDNMRKFLDRETQRVKYFEQRRTELSELAEQMEKQAQMAADREPVEATKPSAADEEKMDKLDKDAEEAYKKLEAECLEELKEHKIY